MPKGVVFFFSFFLFPILLSM